MPELARGQWEHLFEPWFAETAREPSDHHAPQPTRESLFRQASQPLAVRRTDYIRQSPRSRSLEERTARVSDDLARLLTFAERRHLGVEAVGSTAQVQRPHARRLASALPTGVTSHPSATPMRVYEPDKGQRTLPRSGRWRAFLVGASIVAVAFYVVSVQRSAALAMSRATAAERTVSELQRSAENAVAAAAARAERAIADALTQSARAERMIAVMAAPDARRIELAGRGAAPAAVGQALYSRSRGVLLSATDMPRPLEGHPLQVWATTAAGPVRIGSAIPDAQGRLAAAYDLPSTVAGAVLGFMITADQAEGSERPGIPVLANR
jgi:hypothetical protein